MRIMHVESGRHLYGGARQVCYLIDGLKAEGVESVLVCARGSGLAGAVRGARGERAAEVHGTEVVEMPMGGDLDVLWAGRLRRLIKVHAPSVVHVHSRRGADLVGGWCARWAGVPAVLTRRVDNREPAWWARLKYRPYHVVAAISAAVESELVHHVGLDPARVVKVTSAVETGRYGPADWPAARERLASTSNVPDGAIIVGVVAQLIARKGHVLLLDCLPEVLARHAGVHVLCFGRGPLQPVLRREIDSRGLGDRVRLVGFRDNLGGSHPGIGSAGASGAARGSGLGGT